MRAIGAFLQKGGVRSLEPAERGLFLFKPPAQPYPPFQGTLADAHIPVMLILTPSGRQMPLEQGIRLHGLELGSKLAGH